MRKTFHGFAYYIIYLKKKADLKTQTGSQPKNYEMIILEIIWIF